VPTWHLLTKDEDYRFAGPTITPRKLRSLQRKAAVTGPRISQPVKPSARRSDNGSSKEAERNYRNYVAFKARKGAGAAIGD
jgi:hypothetical protein